MRMKGKGDSWTYSALQLWLDDNKFWEISQRQDASYLNDFRINYTVGGTIKNYFVIEPIGNVGIGKLIPNCLLEVNGSAGKPGGGSWSISSDIRLKKNVKPIKNALEKMLELQGITYQWKEPSKHGNMQGAYMSMIAQEVEKVFPE